MKRCLIRLAQKRLNLNGRLTRTACLAFGLLLGSAAVAAGPFDVVELPLCDSDERPGYLFGVRDEEVFAKCYQSIKKYDEGTGDLINTFRPFPYNTYALPYRNQSMRHALLDPFESKIWAMAANGIFAGINSTTGSALFSPYYYSMQHVFSVSRSANQRIAHEAYNSNFQGILYHDADNPIGNICYSGWGPYPRGTFFIRYLPEFTSVADSFFQTTDLVDHHGGINTIWVPWEVPGFGAYINIVNMDTCVLNDEVGDLMYPIGADLLTIRNVEETGTVWVSVDGTGLNPSGQSEIDVYDRTTLQRLRRITPGEVDIDRRFAFTYSPEEHAVLGVAADSRVFRIDVKTYAVSYFGVLQNCPNNGDSRWPISPDEAAVFSTAYQRTFYDEINRWFFVGCDDKVVRFKINPLPPLITFTKSPATMNGGAISTRFAEFEGMINGTGNDAVESLEYKLDEASWKVVNKCQGEFTHTSAKFSLTLTQLFLGQHTVQLRATGASGGTSEPVVQTFEVVEESPTPTHKIALYYDTNTLTSYHNAFYNTPNPPSPTLGLHVFAAGSPPVEVGRVEAESNAGAVTAWVHDLSKEYFVVYKNPSCLVRN